MLAGTTFRPGHGWLNTSAFAFSPPPSFNAKDDPLRSTQPTCSSLLHASTSANQNLRNLLLSRHPSNGPRKRPYDLATAGSTSLMYRRGGLSCLRGGSSAEGEPRPASMSDDGGGVNGGGSGTPFPTATGGKAGSDGGGSGGDTRQQLEGVELSPAFQRPVEPAAEAVAAAAATTTSADFGVALVTERSTATGGSKSRVSYSVLADGTLQVGPPRRRQATADLVRQSSTSLYLSLFPCLSCMLNSVCPCHDRW